ncbi:hypothetical protein KCU98_g3805, partial [Aureobasidium melanogenum]
MPTNLLSLPPELLLLVATCLPPSKILLLRLVNKHLCAAIEKAFKAICCTEVTVSLTCSGLRSLVRFSRSSLAAHVKVLLLKIDGVYTHLQIKSVRVQILPQRCPCSSSQTPWYFVSGRQVRPQGYCDRRSQKSKGPKMAVMGNIKHVFTKSLLPAAAASGIAISTLHLDVQDSSLYDYDTHAHNPLISWLQESCAVSSAMTCFILLRHHYFKDKNRTL